MSVIGNVVWIIFGGLVEAIGWVIAGILCMITIVGIPAGLQCFKLAQLQLTPFGKQVKKTKSSPLGTIGNVLWIVFYRLVVGPPESFICFVFHHNNYWNTFCFAKFKIGKTFFNALWKRGCLKENR